MRVKVESIGPDAPLIWYLNLSIVDPGAGAAIAKRSWQRDGLLGTFDPDLLAAETAMDGVCFLIPGMRAPRRCVRWDWWGRSREPRDPGGGP